MDDIGSFAQSNHFVSQIVFSASGVVEGSRTLTRAKYNFRQLRPIIRKEPTKIVGSQVVQSA